MTREEIIRMAQEARGGLDSPWEFWVMTPSALERFAALVAVAEREACAKVCDSFGTKGSAAVDCADAIRARGDQ